MPQYAGASLTHALGGWLTADVSAVEPIEAESLLIRAVVDGATIERLFGLEPDPFGAQRSKQASAQTWTQSFGPPAALETVITTELLTEPEIRNSGLSNISLYQMDATLGSDSADIECQDNRPTKEALARRVLEAVGIGLVVYAGPGLPFLSESVDYNYRTIGKTVQQVVNDLLMESSPRWWGVDMTLYLDGRELPSGLPPALVGIEEETERLIRGARPTEPELDTVGPDPDAGDTFETLDDATHTWTETSGAGEEYKETTFTVQKAGGQVVYEEELQRGWVATPSSKNFSTESRNLKEHDYHPLCPEALAYSNEATYRTKDMSLVSSILGERSNATPGDAPWSLSEGALLYNALPTTYLQTRKEVRQVWHAEGWLKARTETGKEYVGLVAIPTSDRSAFSVQLLYRVHSRTETYLPIGNGLWNVRTTVRQSESVPVFEPSDPSAGPSDPQYGVVEAANIASNSSSHSYSQITDAGPPTVSCGKVNPCEETLTPAQQASRKYARDLLAYQAALTNDPDRTEYTYRVKAPLLDIMPGDVLGGCYVASVGWMVDVSGNTIATDLTLWSRL